MPSLFQSFTSESVGSSCEGDETHAARAISTLDHRKESVRDKYLHTLKLALTGSLYPMAGRCSPKDCKSTLPYDAELRERGNDWPPAGYTMVGNLRLDNIRWILEDWVRHHIPGDFVELVVWRGGSCIFARAVLDSLDEQHRKVILFDAFGEIPSYGQKSEFLSVSKEDVEATFGLLGFSTGDNVKFVEGLFHNTIPKYAKDLPDDQVISVLRIDGNFYSSYQDAMYHLYDRVPVGGYVIFDDILSTPGVQQFWKDFKSDQGITEEFTPIDDHSTWFKKVKAVKTDWTHYKNDVGLWPMPASPAQS
jgi:hypothetical protein